MPLRRLFLSHCALATLARYLFAPLNGQLLGAGLAAFAPPEPAEFLGRFVFTVRHTAQRKKNSKQPMPVWEAFLGKPIHQHIETVFSRLTTLFVRKIRAVMPRGFELKIFCFPLGFSI